MSYIHVREKLTFVNKMIFSFFRNLFLRITDYKDLVDRYILELE